LVENTNDAITYDTLIRNNMITSIIPFNCEQTAIANACDPNNATEYNFVLKGFGKNGLPFLNPEGQPTPILFDGNPIKNDEWSMCTTNGIKPTTTATMSTRCGQFLPGEKQEVLLAMFPSDFNLQDGCQSIGGLRYRQQVAESLYQKSFIFSSGPPTPNMDLDQTDSGINISLSDIPYDYFERIPELINVYEDDRYKFEGVKVFQVKSANFDFSELYNPEVSRLVYQGDIQNNVSNLFNQETVSYFDTVAASHTLKVLASNQGIEGEFTLEKDAFTDTPFSVSKAYHFAVVSYAYNNYEPYDWLNYTGQRFPYLESTYGLKTVSTEPLLSSENVDNSQAYRLSLQGSTWRLYAQQDPLIVSLFSYDGIQVYQQDLSTNKSLDSQEVGSLPTGIYILSIVNKKNGKRSSHKVLMTP